MDQNAIGFSFRDLDLLHQWNAATTASIRGTEDLRIVPREKLLAEVLAKSYLLYVHAPPLNAVFYAQTSHFGRVAIAPGLSKIQGTVRVRFTCNSSSQRCTTHILCKSPIHG